jgi:putative ABC transport system permease protein
MLAMAEGAKRETLNQISELGADNIILRSVGLSEDQKRQAAVRSSPGLSDADISAVRGILPLVDNVSALKEIPSGIAGPTEETVFSVFSVKPSFAEINRLQIRDGRFLCPIDEDRRQQVCVVGNEAALELGVEGRSGRVINIDKVPYTIVGILQNRNYVKKRNSAIAVRDFNRAVFLPIGAEPTQNFTGNGYTDIIFHLSDGSFIKRVADIIRKIVLENHGGYEDFQTIVPVELLNQFNKTRKTFNIVLGIIAGITLMVGGIGIMNIMAASVTERTREIGIRRSVGANRRHILIQFLTESTMLTMTGGIIGFVIGVIGALVIQLSAEWPVVISLWSVCISLLAAAGTGICFGLYPAYKAAMMDPVEALRF